MGNCRNSFESISSRVMGLPPAVCDEYHKLIEECIVLSKEGEIYFLNDSLLPFISENRLNSDMNTLRKCFFMQKLAAML